MIRNLHRGFEQGDVHTERSGQFARLHFELEAGKKISLIVQMEDCSEESVIKSIKIEQDGKNSFKLSKEYLEQL